MIIVHIVEPFASGVALFVKSLTDAMPDDMHIIIHGERKEEIAADTVKKKFNNSPGIRFIRWRSATRAISPLKDFLAFAELYQILRKLKKSGMADAVHLHSSKSGFLGRAACRMAGIKNVFYTPNGASFLSARAKWKVLLYRFFEKIGYRLGGKVICSSSSELEEYQAIGIEACYINNGTDVKEKHIPSFKKQEKRFRMVTSGRIEEQKNPELFNEIASYFADMPEMEFTWIGEGRQKKYLQSPNIQITGWLPAEHAQELVAAADLYLSTSRYEGLPFAVLEALALKKPVLLSKCTGNSDLVKHGINGSLFKTATTAIMKILQYYNNKEMLKVMGEFSGAICSAEFDGRKNFKLYRSYYAGHQPGFTSQRPVFFANL